MAVPSVLSPRRQPVREAAARTYARSLPVVPVRARGMTVEGADGRRYLDCLSGAGTSVLGHNHPVVLEAIRSVLDSGAPLHAPHPGTPVKEAFTEALFATLPAELGAVAAVRFCGPGDGDAADAAAELAREATGQPGLLVEPVRGNAGVRVTPDAWLSGMRDMTARQGIALIADETQTGIGRTGAFWAIEHSGTVPDVMVLPKAIGGSLPLSVLVHRADLAPRPAAPEEPFRANQLAIAAGTATLDHVRRNALAQRAAAVGRRILDRLQSLRPHHHVIGDVRGRGLLIGLELADRHTAAAVQRQALLRGLIVDTAGRAPSVLRLMPALTITDEQAEAVLDRLADALRAVERGRPPEESSA